jgi:hypothetical protein
MMHTFGIDATCVMGCATHRLRIPVSASDLAGLINLPSCSCGSEVLLMSSLQLDDHPEVVFTPPLSPRELSDLLFGIVLPPESDV